MFRFKYQRILRLKYVVILISYYELPVAIDSPEIFSFNKLSLLLELSTLKDNSQLIRILEQGGINILIGRESFTHFMVL